MPDKALEKFIIERNDRFVAAGVALTAGAPKELAVDATRLVVFRQDDMQAARAAHRRVQLNVCAAAGHVGCDRDAARLTRTRDDLGLRAILSRIENHGFES